MSWENDVFGSDDQIFEDDFRLYKEHNAREQARWGGGSGGGFDDSSDDDIGGSYYGGHYVGRATGGLTPAAKPKEAEPKADALFRLNIAKGLIASRNRARVRLVIYCLMSFAIAVWALVSTNSDAGGVFWALLMLACIVGAVWAYNKTHGGADELYKRALKQYNELQAKDHGAEAESKAAEDN